MSNCYSNSCLYFYEILTMKINIGVIIAISIMIWIILWLVLVDLMIRTGGIYEKQTYIYEQFKDLDLKCNN